MSEPKCQLPSPHHSLSVSRNQVCFRQDARGLQTVFTCIDVRVLLALDTATKDDGAHTGHATLIWKESLNLLFLRTLGLHDADCLVDKNSTDGVKSSTCCANKPLFRFCCFSTRVRKKYLFLPCPIHMQGPTSTSFDAFKDKTDDE